MIGLTGGIACGKSEVARVLSHLGAAVAEADEYAHEALRPGTKTYRRVVKLFGTSVVRPDGTIDRRAVARQIIKDERLRKALEKMVHPIVIRRLAGWVRRTALSGRHAVAVVPLLYEVGMTDLWDAVICVSAPARLVFERLAARGVDRTEARGWIRAQWPLAKKEQLANYVIKNDGSRVDLRNRTLNLWKRILRTGAIRS